MSEYDPIRTMFPIGEECRLADKIPASPLRGPYTLRLLRDSKFKGKPIKASQKQEVIDLLRKSDIHICKEWKANFARPKGLLRAVINSKCSAKIRVRCKVTVVEVPAFLVIPPGTHEWTAYDETLTWDMEEDDVLTFPLGGVLGTGFGTLSNVRLEHDGGDIWARGTWTGPRSGVSYDQEFPRSCVGTINSTQDAPYQFYLGFSPQISDATFQESNPPDPGRPPSDNFNALPWKDFWHYKTFSPKEAYPIGVWGIAVMIYSYGKV